MSEQKQSYIGVSGVTSPEMQSSLEEIAKEAGLKGKGRVLALGVKAVHKTQYLDIENKYGEEWYPVGESFNEALRHDNPNPDTIAVAQAYFDIKHVDDPDYREQFLNRILRRGEPWLQAIQFDMLPWHNNPEMWNFLEHVKEHDVQIFLQAHKDAMETLGPKGTVRLLGRQASLVDYVLFDSSHGTGTRLNTDALEPFVEEAYEQFDTAQTGVAIAGGLNSNIVREDLPQLVETYPDLSWDAEGQLHPVNEHGKRPLDLETTREYLEASAGVLESSTRP